MNRCQGEPFRSDKDQPGSSKRTSMSTSDKGVSTDDLSGPSKAIQSGKTSMSRCQGEPFTSDKDQPKTSQGKSVSTSDKGVSTDDRLSSSNDLSRSSKNQMRPSKDLHGLSKNTPCEDTSKYMTQRRNKFSRDNYEELYQTLRRAERYRENKPSKSKSVGSRVNYDKEEYEDSDLDTIKYMLSGRPRGKMNYRQIVNTLMAQD